jgi:hypothetical protein
MIPGAIRSTGLNRVGNDLAFSVDGISESVHHTADHRVSNRNAHDSFRTLYFVAFFDLLEVAEQHRTDLVFFEVERKTANTVRVFQQLTGHDLFKTVDFAIPSPTLMTVPTSSTVMLESKFSI